MKITEEELDEISKWFRSLNIWFNNKEQKSYEEHEILKPLIKLIHGEYLLGKHPGGVYEIRLSREERFNHKYLELELKFFGIPDDTVETIAIYHDANGIKTAPLEECLAYINKTGEIKKPISEQEKNAIILQELKETLATLIIPKETESIPAPKPIQKQSEPLKINPLDKIVITDGRLLSPKPVHLYDEDWFNESDYNVPRIKMSPNSLITGSPLTKDIQLHQIRLDRDKITIDSRFTHKRLQFKLPFILELDGIIYQIKEINTETIETSIDIVDIIMRLTKDKRIPINN